MSVNSMKDSMQFRSKALVAGSVLIAMTTVMSATETMASDWEYGLSIYGWLPSISGNLNYSPPGSSGDINVDAEQIIDSLQFTFMGSFEARNGVWSGFTDVIYLDLSGDKSKSVGLADGTTFDADLELTGWIWTLGGSYNVWREQKSHLDLLAGVRLLSLDTEVKLSGGGPLQRDRSLSDSLDLWDGIIGVKGRYTLNYGWFLPYYFDVGTGDTELTWQAMGGVGYAFDWGEVSLSYRYLEYDQGDDELLQDIGFGGAKLGVAFRF